MFRAFVLLVLLLPTAAATVTIEGIEVPDRTAADHVFPVNVTVTNDGEARRIYLFAALYDRAEGGDPCGPATDPRFRTFTPLSQEAIDVPARATVRLPTQGEWLHRYHADDAPPSPTIAEFCVFVANASTGPLVEYESFAATPLSVRARNAAPAARFTWSPESPVALRAVQFQAEATDAEGDPVTFMWDFGHFAASGRATAEGAQVTHEFYPAGDFQVTLSASDGLDAASITRALVVTATPNEERGSLLPMNAWIPAVAIAIALMVRRR